MNLLSLTHLYTHSLTFSLSHSLTHSLTHNCLSYTENRAGLEADALDRDSTADCQRLLHRQETDCRISQRGTQSNQHSTGLLFSLFSFVWPTVTFGIRESSSTITTVYNMLICTTTYWELRVDSLLLTFTMCYLFSYSCPNSTSCSTIITIHSSVSCLWNRSC